MNSEQFNKNAQDFIDIMMEVAPPEPPCQCACCVRRRAAATALKERERKPSKRSKGSTPIIDNVYGV